MHQPSPRYWSDAPLTVLYRGLTLRLEAGDPRLPFIDLLLFGEALPKPFAAPPPAEAVEPPPPVVDIDVPDAWVELWKSLRDEHRRVLVELSREELTSPALEKRLRLPKEGLRAVNIVISLRAREAGLEFPVDGIGRGRARRRYFVVEEARPWVFELERRWALVREAMAQASR